MNNVIAIFDGKSEVDLFKNNAKNRPIVFDGKNKKLSITISCIRFVIHYDIGNKEYSLIIYIDNKTYTLVMYFDKEYNIEILYDLSENSYQELNNVLDIILI